MNDKLALPHLNVSHDIYTAYVGAMVSKTAPVIFRHSVMADPFAFGDRAFFPVMCVEKTIFGSKGPAIVDVTVDSIFPTLYALEDVGETWFLTFDQAARHILDNWTRVIVSGEVVALLPSSLEDRDDVGIFVKPKRVVPPDMDPRP